MKYDISNEDVTYLCIFMHRFKTGIIVGSIVGGVTTAMGFCFACFLIRRRQSKSKGARKIHTIDLFQGYHNDEDNIHGKVNLPTNYMVEPFVLPSSLTSPSILGSCHSGIDHPRKISISFTTDFQIPMTTHGMYLGSGASYSQKNLQGSETARINFVQHRDEDAAPKEFIELPPAYERIRRSFYLSLNNPDSNV